MCKHNNKGAIIALTLLFSKERNKQITQYIDKEYSGEFINYRVPVMCRYYGNGKRQLTITNAKNQKKAMRPEFEKLILNGVNCVYIPAIKDYKSIINAQMMRKIVSATFHGWGKGITVSKTLGKEKQDFARVLESVQKVLNGSGDYITEIISKTIPQIQRFDFSLPYENLEEFLGRLDFEIKEDGLGGVVSLSGEGSGIQSFTIYSMLRLLYALRPKNTYKHSEFVWLIEEPETFMHHDLQNRTFDRLKEYSKDGYIFISTHSPVFIDKDNFQTSYQVTKKAHTAIERITTEKIRQVIAGSLGVSFQDFFMFGRYNILVEGESDITILKGLNELFAKGGKPNLLDLSATCFIPCGGVNSMAHFYGMYNAFNKYASFIALVDRDSAGSKALSELSRQKAKVVQIPVSSYKPDAAVEDIVDKSVWDKCLRELDAKGLIELKTKRGNITGYTFSPKNRVDVKKAFSTLLVKYAKKDLSKFEEYHKLLQNLARLLK